LIDKSIIKKKLNEISKQEWGKNRTKDKQKERQIEFYKNLICIDHNNADTNFSIFSMHAKNIPTQKNTYKNRYSTQLSGPPPEV
jgi:hypothetical protein